ncbi:YnaM/YnfT family protein [Raoultella terrigena]|uniref:YnaM/YnfT family protein n=1 Tax=Raoultella terrigena TaxID=577 RepID=UPI00349FA09C
MGSVYFYLRNYCSGTQSDYCLYKTIETAVTTLMIVVTTLAVLSLFVLSLAKVGIAVSNNPDEF